MLVPMLQRGNAYHMGSHAGAWEPGKNDHLKCKPENEGCQKDLEIQPVWSQMINFSIIFF